VKSIIGHALPEGALYEKHLYCCASGSDLFYTYQSFYSDFANGIPGNDITPPALYRLNANTGVATMIGPTGPLIVGSAHIGGVLYGFELDTSGGASHIVSLNTTTGTASFVADLDPSLTFVYAAVAIPEPSCLVLLLAGLLGLAVCRGRRCLR
jgi:hypothetical protein